MRIVDDFTKEEKDKAQEAFETAIREPASEQAELYMTLLRQVNKNIPEDAVLTDVLMRSQLHKTLERLQHRWIEDYRAKTK